MKPTARDGAVNACGGAACALRAPAAAAWLPSGRVPSALLGWLARPPAGVRAGLLGLVLAACSALALADEDPAWVLKQEDATTGTRVWLRERPGATPAFRATTTISARLSALAAVLLDATRTHEWVYRTREAVLLASDGPTRGVSLVVTAMPWPLEDRESIVAWEMTQDPDTLAVTLAGRSAPDRLPPHPGRVRMPEFESRWQLTPRADGRVDVRFEGSGNPGGNLALPLLRDFVGLAVWQGPWHTVRALGEIVRRPEFARAELPFIREPLP